MILFRIHDTRINGWWDCIRCRRFFTKQPDELYCYDCCKELREPPR